MKENSSVHPFHTFHYCPKCGGAFHMHNEKSYCCQQCGFVYYFNPSTATVAVIINDRNELLVCRRAKAPAQGTLDLPGGFCDMYETAEEGAAREVREETGGNVVRCNYLFSLPNTYLYSGFLVHTIDSFFHCELDDYSHIGAYDDAAESMWISLHDIRPEDFGLESVREGVRRIVTEFRPSQL